MGDVLDPIAYSNDYNYNDSTNMLQQISIAIFVWKEDWPAIASITT